MTYHDFLATKQLNFQPVGKAIEDYQIKWKLFEFQRDVVKWAVGKGRAALFLDAGLGKTFCQLEWAHHIGERTLIIAPLSVARQTVEEAKKLGMTIFQVRSQAEVETLLLNNAYDFQTGTYERIFITNYEMAHHFDAERFGAVVLDESSILKALNSKTRIALTEQWHKTPYRLCCTATPAPNDLKEIVNHADFLGIMTRKEVFATFFINDGGNELETRLKRHAVKKFYKWMASWSIALKKPSDLGYSDTGYELPVLSIESHVVASDYRPDDKLCFVSLEGVQERAKVQRATLEARVSKTAELVNADRDQWIVWHHLNDEGYALQKAIPDSVLVEGSDKPEAKAADFERFQAGEVRVLITKPSIAGFGMNFQNSHQMAFCGINDSWEEYYQAIRRQYRFGQVYPVNVHLIYADVQEAIAENIERKERDADAMTRQLVDAMRDYEVDELKGRQRGEDYQTDAAQGEHWQLLLGDSTERLAELPDDSVDLSVFSPPFIARYAYTATERDMGNSQGLDQFMTHFGFIIRELLRVTKPGRNVCVHCQQVRTTKRDTGEVGLIDFRGAIITAFIQTGFVYYSDFTVDKDAQIQARRKHHVSLLYKTKNTDSSKSGSALADYLLVFKKPGVNAVPVVCDVPNEIWNEWARPVWYGINEIDVLPTQVAKGDDDEMHLCPLQLPFIERCIRLWSNKGETVLDPFAGVGSTPYQAVKLGRKGLGIELKPEYYRTSIKNLEAAEQSITEMDLFKWAAEQPARDEEAIRQNTIARIWNMAEEGEPEPSWVTQENAARDELARSWGALSVQNVDSEVSP